MTLRKAPPAVKIIKGKTFGDFYDGSFELFGQFFSLRTIFYRSGFTQFLEAVSFYRRTFARGLCKLARQEKITRVAIRDILHISHLSYAFYVL